MVSTRHHPKEFPEPTTPSSLTPTKPTTTSSSPTKSKPSSTSPTKSSATTNTSTSLTKSPGPGRPRSQPSPSTSTTGTYTHHPPTFIIIWLLISLPLVLWDTLYVLLRPHTMPGGRFHSPFWTPYALYGTVDYVYGWPAWEAHSGFTAAQGSLNALEWTMGVWYLYTVYTKGRVGKGESDVKGLKWFVLEDKEVEDSAAAVLVLWGVMIMTWSKTVLYWLNEVFSGFANIGHNSFSRLVLLWVIPNGGWIVVPAIAIWVVGVEIWGALNKAGSTRGTEKSGRLTQ